MGVRRRRSSLERERDHVAYAMGVFGVAVTGLIAPGGLGVNALALGGSLGLFAAADALSEAGWDGLREHMFTAMFAMAAAGVGAVSFAGADLLVLNALGAFAWGFLGVIAEHHEKCFGGELAMLRGFRGTFCGVLTSYSGLILAGGLADNAAGGVAYVVGSLLVGAVANEAGMRWAGELSEALVIGGHRGYRELETASQWLPYLCAHVASACLLRAAGRGQGLDVATGYVLSVLGVAAGDALELGVAATGSRSASELVSNGTAVSLAAGAASKCSRLGLAAPCGSVVQQQFQESFCGAISTFCGAAEAVHSLTLALVPEDVLDDAYFGGSLPGSNTLREIMAHPAHEPHQDSDGSSGKQERKSKKWVPLLVRVCLEATVLPALVRLVAQRRQTA